MPESPLACHSGFLLVAVHVARVSVTTARAAVHTFVQIVLFYPTGSIRRVRRTPDKPMTAAGNAMEAEEAFIDVVGNAYVEIAIVLLGAALQVAVYSLPDCIFVHVT